MTKETKDDDLVMVGDGVEDGDQPHKRDDDDRGGEDNRAAVDDEGARAAGAGLEDEEEEDQRLGGGEAADEEQAEARRQEKKSRRQRQKEARERDQREMNFLRQRNEQLERKFSGLDQRVRSTETATIDGRLQQIERALRQADEVYAKAVSDSKGDEAAEAVRIRDGLRDQQAQLKAYKRQQETSAQQPNEPDPSVVENVRQWHGRNSWFRFDRGDQDSAIAGAIDDSLAREGWNPSDPRYYDELDKRIAKSLPHRAKRPAGGNGRDREADDLGDDPPPSQRDRGASRGGPRFRVGGRDRVLKPNEVFVSRERKEAMIEAGVWDDPKLRAKYLKRYADYDKEHANDRR